MQTTDVGRAQRHFIEQSGEMFLQRLIDEGVLHQLQAAEVKLASHGWRQKVTRKDAHNFGLHQHLLEELVVQVDDLAESLSATHADCQMPDYDASLHYRLPDTLCQECSRQSANHKRLEFVAVVQLLKNRVWDI